MRSRLLIATAGKKKGDCHLSFDEEVKKESLEAMEEMLQKHQGELAAFVMEPLM
jgi:adenosylmethionine-8-amino-7-oxononanoate aminotransferase